jgi:hypothetical protein
MGLTPPGLSVAEIKKQYLVELTDEEIKALRKSAVNGPLYHLVKQILDQWRDF